MKKGFISIFTLMVLLILSITITFLFVQNQNMADYNKGLYEKKQAQYLAESVLNKYLDENFDQLAKLILEDFEANTKTDRKKTLRIAEKLRTTYDGKDYTLSIAVIHRKDDKDLDGSYMVYANNIRLGEAQGHSHIYFRVKEVGEESDLFDKNRLEIIIRQTY